MEKKEEIYVFAGENRPQVRLTLVNRYDSIGKVIQYFHTIQETFTVELTAVETITGNLKIVCASHANCQHCPFYILEYDDEEILYSVWKNDSEWRPGAMLTLVNDNKKCLDRKHLARVFDSKIRLLYDRDAFYSHLEKLNVNWDNVDVGEFLEHFNGLVDTEISNCTIEAFEKCVPQVTKFVLEGKYQRLYNFQKMSSNRVDPIVFDATVSLDDHTHVLVILQIDKASAANILTVGLFELQRDTFEHWVKSFVNSVRTLFNEETVLEVSSAKLIGSATNIKVSPYYTIRRIIDEQPQLPPGAVNKLTEILESLLLRTATKTQFDHVIQEKLYPFGRFHGLAEHTLDKVKKQLEESVGYSNSGLCCNISTSGSPVYYSLCDLVPEMKKLSGSNKNKVINLEFIFELLNSIAASNDQESMARRMHEMYPPHQNAKIDPGMSQHLGTFFSNYSTKCTVSATLTEDELNGKTERAYDVPRTSYLKNLPAGSVNDKEQELYPTDLRNMDYNKARPGFGFGYFDAIPRPKINGFVALSVIRIRLKKNKEELLAILRQYHSSLISSIHAEKTYKSTSPVSPATTISVPAPCYTYQLPSNQLITNFQSHFKYIVENFEAYADKPTLSKSSRGKILKFQRSKLGLGTHRLQKSTT